jgi:hypothetical protein
MLAQSINNKGGHLAALLDLKFHTSGEAFTPPILRIVDSPFQV